VQLSIIKNLSKYVKPGGILLYSTCTLRKPENEDIIEAFLSENSEFRAEGFVLPEPVGSIKTGMLTIWPHIHGTDGFFICKMRKNMSAK
jgi:16S rRNA (cytosine967-C5)-methyltransferase